MRTPVVTTTAKNVKKTKASPFPQVQKYILGTLKTNTKNRTIKLLENTAACLYGIRLSVNFLKEGELTQTANKQYW